MLWYLRIGISYEIKKRQYQMGINTNDNIFVIHVDFSHLSVFCILVWEGKERVE